MSQPIVRGNDWRTLPVPATGGWTPTKTVSVVMLAWRPTTLDVVLAALAAQTYPSELMEVLVVDDGNTPPVELPDLRPENTRVVRVEEGWGCANGVETGVAAATGEIIVRLDDDMLVFADHVENHARWHHVVDHAVVLGTKRFVDPEVGLTPEQVRDAVADGSIATLHDWDSAQPHTWVEDLWEATDDLTTAGFGAFRCVVGATISMTKVMYEASGGLDRRLRTGEDSALGHHLAEAGAVFVPDHEARAWHLGLSHAMQDPDLVNQVNAPAFADLLPSMRGKRQRRGRTYQVPYLEVVVPATATLTDPDLADLPALQGGLARVQRCVDSLLDSDMDDLRVVLVGEWSRLGEERVSVLRDPLRDLRVLHRSYVHEPRVELVEPTSPVLERRSRSPLRLVLTSAELALVAPAARVLSADLERTHHGLRVFSDVDGQVVARLERTAAYARAAWHLAADGREGDLAAADAFVDEAFGTGEVLASEAGFVPALERPVARYRRDWAPPVDPHDSWVQARKELRNGVRPHRRAAGAAAAAAAVEGVAGEPVLPVTDVPPAPEASPSAGGGASGLRGALGRLLRG